MTAGAIRGPLRRIDIFVRTHFGGLALNFSDPVTQISDEFRKRIELALMRSRGIEITHQTDADANAVAWNLNQILLPSGAKIDVSYEADDYAYVQNRRAAQMTSILGFGGDKNELNFNRPHNKLFN